MNEEKRLLLDILCVLNTIPFKRGRKIKKRWLKYWLNYFEQKLIRCK